MTGPTQQERSDGHDGGWTGRQMKGAIREGVCVGGGGGDGVGVGKGSGGKVREGRVGTWHPHEQQVQQ